MLSLHSCPLGRPGTKDTGGMSVYLQQISRCLGELGIAVDIFTSNHQPESPSCMLLGDKVRLIHLPIKSHRENGKLGLFPHLKELASGIHDFKRENGLNYNLIHSHYWLSCLAGKLLSEWWNLPHMIMLHTSALAKNKALGDEVEPALRAEGEKEVLDSSSLIVTATERERQDLIELYDAPSDKITVIPCGVDLEMFHPLPKERARSILGLDSSHILLYVGRIEAEKGIEILLEATSLIKRDDIEVFVIGGGHEDRDKIDSLRRCSHKLGIEKWTHFQDAVNQSRLPLYYSAADLCVLPSRYETFGMVALEALACNTPVIASKAGVLAELIKNDAAIVLDELSPFRLASILDRVLEDKALIKRMVDKARPAVLNLSWEQAARKIAGEYERLIKLS